MVNLQVGSAAEKDSQQRTARLARSLPAQIVPVNGGTFQWESAMHRENSDSGFERMSIRDQEIEGQ
jgi:hypothetical protein